MRTPISYLLTAAVLWFPLTSGADTFTIKDDTGDAVTIEARLAGEGQGLVALERADGRLEVVPQSQILKRVVGADPDPISCETMIERLKESFGTEKFRVLADAPFVVGLVLSEPLPKTYEPRAAACLKDGVEFMKTVDKVFVKFLNELKIDSEQPRFPLALLIFETDDDFMRFAAEETGGRGLSVGSMLGYYSVLTNRLVIRMSECHTFATPMHEAVHQQVYNRRLIQRMSPVPVWFHEGIATGFEGNGEKVRGGPLKVSVHYARAAMQAKTVDWDHVVADDKAFRGDVLAGEAYANAWSIHWFLVTKYRKQYVEYLTLLGEKQTLQIDEGQTRIEDFEKAFGKPAGRLQAEFRSCLELEARKQKVSLTESRAKAYSVYQLNLAEVEIAGSKDVDDGDFEAEGRMRNLSQIRPMSFHVTVESDVGTYAEWYLPSVAPRAIAVLQKKVLHKRMKDGPGGAAKSFRVKVKTAVPESDLGKAWQRGQLPVPVWTDG